MARWFGASSVVFMVLLVPAPALAEACQVGKYVEIPVTMAGRRPIVTAQINGRDARFILDSGAFFSTVAKANALEYGLSIRDVAPGVRLKGIGGDAALGATTAKELRIGGQAIPHIDFAVGGSDFGYAGELGQNILGLADVEYDLPHGAVRLMKGQGCKASSMAYWAGTKPVTVVEIEPMDAGQRHTIGTIKINGVKIKALFDSGAMVSMLSLSAAKRIGVTPDSAAATPNGFAYGLGQSRARAWWTRFDSIDIGGGAIQKPWMEIAQLSLDGPGMLIGIDLLLTHP